MARTTAEILEQLQRLVPRYYSAAEPLIAGFAAALAQAELEVESLVAIGLFENAPERWLRLHADGYGIRVATGETDDQLRGRLRRVEDQVTKPAILAAVEAVVGADCQLIEWWDGPYVDVDAYCDMPTSWVSGGPRSFLVIVPAGTGVGTLNAVINEVNRIRAAGVRWWLVVEA